MRVYSEFEKFSTKTGAGLMNSLIDKLPIELHVPKVSIASPSLYCFSLLIINDVALLSINTVVQEPS